MAIGFGACSTPYSALKDISSFEELDYKYPVKKVYLPESEFTIAYTDEGKGDNTIILIHGLGSYLRAWEKNIGELSKTSRVIAIDLRATENQARASQRYDDFLCRNCE